jgi:hypothetical protein
LLATPLQKLPILNPYALHVPVTASKTNKDGVIGFSQATRFCRPSW